MYKSVLFLQGVASSFFSALGSSLEDSGCSVYRVNFCGGDRFFSKGAGQAQQCWNYRDPLELFPDWLGKKLRQHKITDIVLFGDSRPVHKKAIELARKRGLAIHVYEEGYLRPHRITLESGGVNAYSSLPKDPDWYRQHESQFVPGPSKETGYTLSTRAWHDVCFHLSSFALKRRFPHYTTHRPDSPLREYLGWARRFPTLLFHEWKSNRAVNLLIEKRICYYFLPLQLSADTQIREHSPFKNVTEVIERTIASFAKYAPSDCYFVIKNHPLDTGLVNYRQIIKELQKVHNVVGRVIYLEDGYLPTMLRHAKGTVLVNSTVGTSSLFHKIPTCVLGEAIYDMPGLTFQGDLDQFWTQGVSPDAKLYDQFSRGVVHLTQINGDFYSKTGIAMAVKGSLRFFGLQASEKTLKKPIEATAKKTIFTTPAPISIKAVEPTAR